MQYYQWWKNVLNFLSIADAIYTQHLLLCHRHGDTTIVPIPSLSLSLSLCFVYQVTYSKTCRVIFGKRATNHYFLFGRGKANKSQFQDLNLSILIQ